MAPGRKVPFSGKAKKEQLKAKKERKNLLVQAQKHRRFGLNKQPEDSGEDENKGETSQALNLQPTFKKSREAASRYALQFHRESEAEIRARKEIARQPLQELSEDAFEIDYTDFFSDDLDFPTRPPWNRHMSKEELEAREQRYFTEYVKRIEKKYNLNDLSYFELNLETWRQLWRVLEMSDILLIIVDTRFPALMFPPSLYKYVTETLKKDMILILNKIDLAPAPLVVAWKYYFKQFYPKLHILTFTSFPTYNLRNVPREDKGGLLTRRRRGKMRMAAEGSSKLLETCREIVKDQVDLSSWASKISEEMNSEYDFEDGVEVEETVLQRVDTSYQEHVKYTGGVLTIGCLGQPNVGKSSLMNGVMGRKVVSVSKTPGHTKHFQTIYLTPNVRLCDCPGLVFPSKVPKTLQILMGSFPIAQLREPFTTVKYLGERLNLPKLLRITHPEEGETVWSAMDICDGWAKLRGYYTAKAARLDSYRAANSLLRMALDGKICLCLRPRGYNARKDHWENHPEVDQILWIQALDRAKEQPQIQSDISESEEEPEPVKSNEDTGAEQSGEGEQPQEGGNGDEEEDEGSDDEDSDVDEVVTTTASNKFALLGSED